MHTQSRRVFLQRGLALTGISVLYGCGKLPSWLQPVSVPRIGVISSAPLAGDDQAAEQFEAIRQGLREHGYEEGRNILVEWRSLENRPERAPEVVDELLRLGVTAMYSAHPATILAAKRATTTIPIVMAGAFTDPVGQGAVSNLSRPGENVTGLSIAVPTLGDKRLQLLKETVPGIRRLGLMFDRTLGPLIDASVRPSEEAARALGLDPRSFILERSEEIESAFAAMQAEGVDAIHVSNGSLFSSQSRPIADLALQHRLPSIGGNPALVRAGVLLQFGIDQLDLMRRAVGHLDKILKGAKPGDLPVEQPTAFDFVINLKTAQALGLAIPQAVLSQATEIIR